jgi:hypothetical protein
MDLWSPYDYFYKLDPVVALGPISRYQVKTRDTISMNQLPTLAVLPSNSWALLSLVLMKYIVTILQNYSKKLIQSFQNQAECLLLKEGSKLFLEADVGKRVVKFTILNTGRLAQEYKFNRTKVLINDDVDLEDVVDEDMVSEEVDDDNGLFKLVKRKKKNKKKKKMDLLIKTKGGLYLKNFKFDQPTQQPNSNTFKNVNTNRFSSLESNDDVAHEDCGSNYGSDGEEISCSNPDSCVDQDIESNPDSGSEYSDFGFDDQSEGPDDEKDSAVSKEEQESELGNSILI